MAAIDKRAEAQGTAARRARAGKTKAFGSDASQPAAGAVNTFHARILLADDDPDMRKMVARSLRRSGYQVVEVSDGNELLQHLNNGVVPSHYEEPDLVVSDIRMPGQSGIEVLAGLRRANWAMPVILITAFGDRATHEESRRLGAAIVLDKPFEMDELMHAVEAIVPPRF